MKRLLPFCALLASCGGGAPDGTLAVLDLEAAIDNPKTFDLADIAAGIEFIPLDESVPVGEIYTLMGVQPAPDGFYIVAADQMSPVQNFDRTGKFVSTVGRTGRGADETLFIAGIATNDATGDTYIDGGFQIVGLDAAGKGFARNDSIMTYGIMWYGDRLLVTKAPSLFDRDAFASDRIPFIETLDRDLKPAGNIYGPNLGPFMGLSTNPQQEGYVAPAAPPVLAYNGRRLLIKQGRGDTLYNYNAGTLRPEYLLDMGRRTPPAEVFGLDHPVQWSENNFTVDKVFEGDRYMIVSVTNLIEKPSRGLIFDRRDPADGFSATGGADGLPGLFVGGIAFTPCYIRDNRLVGYMRALDIVDNAGSITDPKLREIAAALKDDGNPVMALIRLK